MKKLMILSAVLLSTFSFFMTSCLNTDTGGSMKTPISQSTDSTIVKDGVKEKNEKNEKEENEKNETKTMTKQGSTDSKSKTIDNLQAAYKGEITASAKYAAYSKKAAQEGHREIALLFKTASMSENIHALNHKVVLQEAGVKVPIIKPEYTVKSSKENLEDAIKGESYEIATMYPEFLTTANEADNQLALISLNYAYKTEKKHKTLYETALTAIENNTDKTLPSVFYICPTCGNTYETKAPARCGISMTNGEKFIKIITL